MKDCQYKLEKLFTSEIIPIEFYCGTSHAQANCVKTILKISSQVFPKHKKPYEELKNYTFNNWKKILLKTGIVKEFTDRGVKKIQNAETGAFIIWANQRNIVCNVGLCINENYFYYLDLLEKRGFVKKCVDEIKPVFIGIL